MGKSKRDDDDLKKLKKLKKLLGEDKLRQELEEVPRKRERKKNKKKKSRHSSSDEVWEEKKVENKNEYHSNNQDRDKRGDKLDWMYKGADDLVDNEEYLLGKKIDQAIVKKQSGDTAQKSEDTSSSFGAIFGNSASIQPVDMTNKLREDPLFLIKQQEINKKKDLLNNPVRMKQLQQLLQNSKQSKKKKKKQKKKRSKSSSESSSESDREEAKIKKYQGYGLINSSKRLETRIPKSSYEERHRQSSPQQKQGNYYRQRESHRHSSPVRQHNRSRSPYRSCRSRSRSPRNRSSGSHKKMDAKEMERKREEMMKDAKSWDEDRKSRVQRYREEDRVEREAERNKSRSADFVQPMKFGASSVEDRIKRNIYNIQRTSVALDKNFAKR